jgi:formylglycine-generating enzyme required for sulfatase activity
LYTSKGFWLGKYPVTQAEWTALTGESPSYFQAGREDKVKVKGLDTSRFPVEQVSWDTITQSFLPKMNALDGVKTVFETFGEVVLPHEDEWEYACRGGKGNTQPFYWGADHNGTQANMDGNYPFNTDKKGPYLERPTSLGGYAAKYPHPWGLCDMHGNVWESCENCYDQTNDRVLRGGSWYNLGRYCRAANRAGCAPDYLKWDIGVRLAFRLDA